MNNVTLYKYYQSAFLLEASDGSRSERFVFDLGSEITPELAASMRPAEAVFISHQHPDHFSIDAIRALSASHAYGPTDVSEKAEQDGISMKVISSGDQITVGNLSVECFTSDHGPNISAPIPNLGFVLRLGGQKIFFAGDMAVASGPQNSGFDVVLVPVGGSKVFTPEAALDYLRLISHRKIVVPIHYHGRADRQAGEKFRELADGYCDVRVLDVGESLQL